MGSLTVTKKAIRSALRELKYKLGLESRWTECLRSSSGLGLEWYPRGMGQLSYRCLKSKKQRQLRPLEGPQTRGVSLFLQSVINLFACRADRKFFRVSTRYPFLATKRADGFSRNHRLRDFLFTNIMRKTFVVAFIGRG